MTERTVATRPSPSEPKRLILVRFGGGVRFKDLFDDPNHSLAPNLRRIATDGTFAPDVWNSHLTRHDCATSYLLTGQYGARLSSNSDGEANLAELATYPLLGEVYRQAADVDESRVLAAGTPPFHVDQELGGLTFGNDMGPPSISGDPSLPGAAHVDVGNDRLLQVATDVLDGLPRSKQQRREYLSDAIQLVLDSHPVQHAQLTPAFKAALLEQLLANKPFVTAEQADEWLVSLTLQAMADVRPNLITIGLSTPDLAHRGNFGVYSDAVRRNDLLVERLWSFVEQDSYYRGRTNMIVVPDCGRGADHFEEHLEPFDTPSHRRLFMVAIGPAFRRHHVLHDRIEQVDIAATAARALGFDLDGVEGNVVEGAFA